MTTQLTHSVTTTPAKEGRGLHLFLSIITCGAWLPVWLLIELLRLPTRGLRARQSTTVYHYKIN